MGFRVTSKGDFKRTRKSLNTMLKNDIFRDLDKYGQQGVEALSAATPVESGLTGASWKYRLIKDPAHPGIEWYNTHNVDGGASVAVLIQFGHGTGTGGYVPGRDFINPAMKPIFQKITDDVWKKVRS